MHTQLLHLQPLSIRNRACKQRLHPINTRVGREYCSFMQSNVIEMIYGYNRRINSVLCPLHLYFYSQRVQAMLRGVIIILNQSEAGTMMSKYIYYSQAVGKQYELIRFQYFFWSGFSVPVSFCNSQCTKMMMSQETPSKSILHGQTYFVTRICLIFCHNLFSLDTRQPFNIANNFINTTVIVNTKGVVKSGDRKK